MPDSYPKITIITPCYNLGQYLEQTILSIINQNYPNLEYIVIDGGSTDNTVEIIEKYREHIAYWVSEPDEGIYHALQKGFEKSTGDIMAWLNADDMYHAGALMRVKTVFQQFPQIKWLTGFPSVYDEGGTMIVHPPGTFKKWSKYEVYLGHYQWIQQESTFWTRDLWEAAGGYITTQYKVAGDFELWLRFFRFERLYSVPTPIGGYRVRKEQLSRSKFAEYKHEIQTMIEQEPLDEATQKRVNKIKLLGRILNKTRAIDSYRLKRYYYQLFDYPYSVVFSNDSQTLSMNEDIDRVDFKLKMYQ